MQKPTTVPFITYYLGALNQICRSIRRLYNRLAGRWYCGHCRQYHSKRTIAYNYSDGMTDDICSLGIAAAGLAPGSCIDGPDKAKRRIYLTTEAAMSKFFTIQKGV